MSHNESEWFRNYSEWVKTWDDCWTLLNIVEHWECPGPGAIAWRTSQVSHKSRFEPRELIELNGLCFKRLWVSVCFGFRSFGKAAPVGPVPVNQWGRRLVLVKLQGAHPALQHSSSLRPTTGNRFLGQKMCRFGSKFVLVQDISRCSRQMWQHGNLPHSQQLCEA